MYGNILADNRFMQACMELIDRQTYGGWSLPKNWHIVLTTNPDNGEYFVTAMDQAQKTRFITVHLKFDVKVWAKWAEETKIDSRCINFLLLNKELMSSQSDFLNPRSTTLFFNAISSITDFNTAHGLSMIQKFGESAVGPEFTTQFTLFINNKLDKLMSPEDIFKLSDKEEDIINKMRDLVYKDGAYRADIAAVMAERIVNYSIHHADKNTISKDYLQRFASVIKAGSLFSNDLRFSIGKRVINGNKQKFQTLLQDNAIQKMITA